MNIVYWDEVCQYKDYVRRRKNMSALLLLWKTGRLKSIPVDMVKQTCGLSLESGYLCIDVGKDGTRSKAMMDPTPYTRITSRCGISVGILS